MIHDEKRATTKNRTRVIDGVMRDLVPLRLGLAGSIQVFDSLWNEVTDAPPSSLSFRHPSSFPDVSAACRRQSQETQKLTSDVCRYLTTTQTASVEILARRFGVTQTSRCLAVVSAPQGTRMEGGSRESWAYPKAEPSFLVGQRIPEST